MMDPALKNRLGYIHGGLMIFAWVVAVPIAIAANIYARKKNKTWGTKVHMIVMATIAFLPFTISGIMAFTMAGTIRAKPHSVMAIGTVLTLGAWVQVLLGAANHYLYRYRLKNNCLPITRPWNNRIHIWLGRTLSLIALINIPLGLKIKRVGLAIYVLYGIWIGLLAFLFLYLVWMKQEGPQLDIKPETSLKISQDNIHEEINHGKH